MVDVAQLVRAPDCGSGGRGFKSHLPPKPGQKPGFFIFNDLSLPAIVFMIFCHTNLNISAHPLDFSVS